MDIQLSELNPPLDPTQPIERDAFLDQPWPCDFIIGEGLLALTGGSLLIGGEAGIGKSILTLQLAHELATGSPALGLIDVIRPARVLLVQFEMAPAVYQERLRKAATAFPHYMKGQLYIVTVPHLPLAEATAQSWLKEQVTSLDAEVVILDPMYPLGFSDENDAASVVEVLDGLKTVMAETGVSVVLTHHTRKPQFQAGKQSDKGMHEIRGSTHFTAWPDTVAVLNREKEGLTMHFAKTRTAPETVGDVRLELDRETMTFRGAWTNPLKEAPTARAVEVLRKNAGRMRRDQLESAVGVSASTLDRAMARLKMEGLVRSVPDEADRRRAYVQLIEVN